MKLGGQVRSCVRTFWCAPLRRANAMLSFARFDFCHLSRLRERSGSQARCWMIVVLVWIVGCSAVFGLRGRLRCSLSRG